MARRRGRSMLGAGAGTALLYPASFAVLILLSSPLIMLMSVAPYRGVERDVVTLTLIWSALSSGLTCLLMRIFLGAPLFLGPEGRERGSQSTWRPRPGTGRMAGHLMADVAVKASQWDRHLRERGRRGP